MKAATTSIRLDGRRPYLFALTLLAALSLAACGGDDGNERTGAAETSTGSVIEPGPPPDEGPETSGGTPIQITVGETRLAARLDDTATARDLVDQLPLTLTFRDHNRVEKTAPLSRDLTTEGAPDGHDPVAGDIGYWAPGGDLVVYYDDGAPYFDGIIRIGRVDGDVDIVARQDGHVQMTFERR